MKPTGDFQTELNAALAALGKDTADSIPAECPDPEAVMAHARGSALDDEIATHLQACPSCSELAAVAHRQKKIYERQRLAFRRAASEKRSWRQEFAEAFLPLAWLRRPAVTIPMGAVAALVLGFALWQKPDFDIPGSGYSANQLVINIEKSDPHDPALTEASLREVLSGTKQGERIDPTQIQQARLAVDQKKTEVSGTPDLSGKWDKIDDQLAVVEWWNRYQVLRKKGSFVAPMSVHVWDLAGSDGTGKVRLSWDPTRSQHDLSLLQTSLSQTQGLEQVIITTPENKTFTVAAPAGSSTQPK
jgi:hypothetical protein